MFLPKDKEHGEKLAEMIRKGLIKEIILPNGERIDTSTIKQIQMYDGTIIKV